MSKAFRSLFIFPVFCSVIFSGCFYKETGNNLVLKKDNCEIVVPDKSCEVFAARELQAILSESLGAKVEIVKTPTPSKISLEPKKRLSHYSH
ncbi:MAG: hypothetical protein A2020_05080 [Lentisphaerae bacterium GWF2_45_14]|nr:MAG: hypothetical protein A2020_05080 [Lentisphaerae bacterium GWF2_45_14]